MSDERIRAELERVVEDGDLYRSDLLRVLGAIEELGTSLCLAAFVTSEPRNGGEGPDDDVPGEILSPIMAVGCGDGPSGSVTQALDGASLPTSEPAAIRQHLRNLLEPEQRESLVSWPVCHRDEDQRFYFCVAILTLNTAALRGYPRLPEEVARERSFLEFALAGLAQDFAALDGWGRIAPAERARRSASGFLSDLIQATLAHAFGAPLWRDTFADLCAVAAMRYEGADPNARLMLCRPGEGPQTCEVEFSVPIPLSSHRLVRKQLETCRPNRGVLVSRNLRLLGRVDEPATDQVLIRFRPQGVWQLKSHGSHLLTVRNGKPLLPPLEHIRGAGSRRLAVDFPEFPEPVQLQGILGTIADGGHGATLVIAADAAEEAGRLSGQGTVLTTALPYTGDLLHDLGSVDGAVLLNGRGQIVAFGVILDGLAGDPPGDAARGSRYNSAFNYVRTRTSPPGDEPRLKATAIVVSADGSVDWITRGSIMRRSIEQERARAHQSKLSKIANWQPGSLE